MILQFLLLLLGSSSFYGSSAAYGTAVSKVEFKGLLQNLKDRHYYTGATVLRSSVGRSDIVYGITLLIPTEQSLMQSASTQHHYRRLLRLHILGQNISFRELKSLSVGTWLPTELPGYGVQVTHNSPGAISLNYVPVVEANICPNLVERGIRCHGVNGVLGPLSRSPSPAPKNSLFTPAIDSSSPTPSPSPASLQAKKPSSPMVDAAPSGVVLNPTQTSPSPSPGDGRVLNPTQTSSFPSPSPSPSPGDGIVLDPNQQTSSSPLPPVFQSPVTGPLPPAFGIPPFLLGPTPSPSESMAVPATVLNSYIFALGALVGLLLMQHLV